MPEMDGLEATRVICLGWPKDERPRIIAMTANAMQEDRAACFESGMDDYLSKPICVPELINALNKSQPRFAISSLHPRPEPSAQLHAGTSHLQQKDPTHSPSARLRARLPLGMFHLGTSSPQQRSGEDILDAAALKNLRDMTGGDPAFLVELIDTFFEDGPQLLEDIRQAVEQEGAAALRLAAHSLKSNSAQFGALALSSLCRELEEMGKAGTLEDAAEKLALAEVAYEQAKDALDAIRSEG